MIFRISGCVLIALFFIICFVKKEPSLSFAVSLSLFLLICLTVIDGLKPLLSFLSEIEDKSSFGYMKLLIKALGIGLVCSALSGLCKRAGEEMLSNAVEMFGKIEILVLCLPLLRELLEVCLKVPQ